MQTTTLIGRTEALAVVHATVARAVAGSGGLLLFLGEAGVGKSRLLGEVARLAQERGMRVLEGRAAESGGAYRPLAEALLRGGAEDLDRAAVRPPYRAALGRLLPGWTTGGGEAPEPGVDPALVLGEAVVHLLRALVDGPCLLVLDDLHWADADTLALLGYLAGRLGDSRVLVAAAARDDEPNADALDRLAAGPGVRATPLTRLAPAELATLVRARTREPLDDDVLAALVARADGLPLLAEELLVEVLRSPPAAGAPPPVPRTVAALARRRLALLEPVAQQCLRVAAVAGTEPDWAVLPAAVGQPEAVVLAAARAAVGASLLREDAGRLRWRHALLREAVVADLVPPERAALARRAGEALLARGREEDAARAAGLLAAGGERERAAGLFLRLARRDRTTGALRHAGQLLDRATGVGADPAAVAVERVPLLTAAGRVGEALEAGVAALPSAAGDLHAELCLQLARAAVTARRWQEAEAYVERSGRPDDARSAVLVADAAFGAGDVDRAGALAATALARAERSGGPAVLCEALDVVGRVARLSDPGQARAAFSRAVQVAAEHRLVPQQVTGLIGLGTAELLVDETSEALPRARELALAAGLLGQAGAAEVILFDAVAVTRGPRAVEERARALLARAARLNLPEVHAASAFGVALARAAAGDPAGTEAALAQLPRSAAWPDAGPLEAAVRALPPLLAHDLAAANATLDAGLTVVVGHRAAAPLHQFGLWALLRTAVDDRGEAAREVLRGLPAALRPANRGALHYADAIAAGRQGRAGEAADLLARGDADLAGLSWLHRLLHLVVLDAAVTDGWGDPVPLLRADLAEHERAGDQQPARTCRALLARAGAPTRRGRGDSPVPGALRAAGVTSREMDVLALVSTGATNAQVAARLHLSPRTVETHVANLLAKLGVPDRGRLRERVAALTR
ncbi:ATP-binding protein [Trujillonella endophytica]|uniref:Regulatory protein, luxR family n=1 Tax=Trujillonella endophytica TaxID=673521 RepID=A0A1H8S9H7_9ACTN|nr:LuxR family transcriptional regulator [Trujillella endophytica]SEO74938.1 regulatory protein, luxR family [Trujillella endophytica]